MAKKDMVQMVDDDEVENVGIMAGFMDDFEDVLEEIMGEEAEMEEGDDADMANMMNRRPDSPEILMNNLRGDIRSLDARREELADLVGYNAASETPEGVLALLQPILAQQQAAAAMPPMAMPPVAPPGVSPVGPSMPPADAGGIASLPMDQGPAPMAMAKGGYVQHFQEGSGEAGVTPAEDPYGAYPQEIVDAAKARVLAMLSQQPAALPDVQARAAELYPEYEAMLGSGKDAAQAQMLFDIGQAALQYAGNVGPGGQPLRGSQAARLAGAVSQLPGKIGATAAGMSKEARALKLAAMQKAEKERAAAQASNLALSEQQSDLYKEIAKQKSSRLLTSDEITSMGLDAALPWQMDQAGKISIAGGRPPAGTNINMGTNKLGEQVGRLAGDQLNTSYNAANGALSTKNSISLIKPILESEDAVFAGPLSGARTYVNRLGSVLGVEGATDQERLNNTVNAMRTLAQFELQAAEAMRGQGQITENERALIRRTAAGELDKMTQQEVVTLLNALEKTADYKIDQHNLRLEHFKSVYADDEDTMKNLRLFELTDVPLFSPANDVRAQADAIIRGDQ